MGELAIRRNRTFAPPRFQGVGKGEKTQSSSASKPAARTTVTVSETLRQLMTRVSQAETHIRESRRTLQTGEGTLDEVQDSLDRMAKLAQKSAQGETAGRDVLQAEAEVLTANIDRMLRSAMAGETPLFLHDDAGLEDGAEALLYAVLGEAAGRAGETQELPDWLMQGLAQKYAKPEQILSALGLDKNATGPEILAAIANSSLENSVSGSLAALYLGAVISGGNDMESALEGLELLLEKVSEGVPMDEAISLLTNGEFSSLAEFQEQFTSGIAPGMEDFLKNLLLSDALPALAFGESPLMSLLANLEGVNLDLMMGLLTVMESGPGENLELVQSQGGAEVQTAGAPSSQSPVDSQTMGNVQVMGRDLSGVTFDGATGVLTVSGGQDVTVIGTGQGEQAMVIAGNGKVTVMNVIVSQLTVTAPEAQLFSVEESVLGEVYLEEGTTLTLDGRGLLRVGKMHGGASNILHVNGGAVILAGEKDELGNLRIPVQVEGAISLAAWTEHAADKGKEPFDVLWDALLPSWSHITSMELDGRQAKMALMNGDPVRLWLDKGDPSHGYTIHTLLARGRDKQGRPQTRYAYLHWNQITKGFQEVNLYPNPFAVTGGEPGTDWIYEEETHTLRILSSRVTALSGGMGTDANRFPFSGRVVLADAIGSIGLTLDGVICRVSVGRALDLGRNNDVTLMLRYGTRNYFESGAGFAGVSLGEGTSLCIDCTEAPEYSGQEMGALIASGASGGAGIGRDSGAGRDKIGQILIRGGVITATGTGGGAGIGAGKQGAFGSITILGGTVTSTGENGGGAGIGGALGAPVGDIRVQGGTVTAVAVCHAAAIGAGVQGECGDIRITGTARIARAAGGDPGADIGACLFGGCGQVLISGGADIGSARLRTHSGVALNMGEDTVTLPQFRLSVQSLGLDQVNLLTQEYSKEAQTTIEAGRQWIARIQGVYRAMYGRLSGRAVQSVQRYLDAAEGPVRDTGAADALLEDMRQTIRLQPEQMMETHNKRAKTDAKHLLR